MKRFLGLFLALLTGTLSIASSASVAAEPKARIPAVAGSFYPDDPQELSQLIDELLQNASSARTGTVKALICPHAGYQYSGPVAATGFRVLRGLTFDTVILLGPSHYARLESASVSDADLFRTPLGDVPISTISRQLAKNAPFALNPSCPVQRPEWARSSRFGPERNDRADTWEHSVEVEVPFLQKTLGAFELVPVVVGDVDPAKAARALEPFLNDSTLLVVSSDLSHYSPYATAQRFDQRCVEAICALDIGTMESQKACGRIPILTLLRIAKAHGWRPQLLDLRNSGDTSGDRSKVVGYAAIVFYAPEPGPLTASDGQYLLKLARRSLEQATRSGTRLTPDAVGLEGALTAKKAAFVTLTKNGQLRGCIGHIYPQMPLYQAVVENVRSAALEDPRFPPVHADELEHLEIEISVLTEPQPLAFTSPDDLLRKLQPKDGVVLRVAAGTATYLPQVWEQIPDKTEFLNSLAAKAGGRPDDWRRPGTTIDIYHVQSLKETDHR